MCSFLYFGKSAHSCPAPRCEVQHLQLPRVNKGRVHLKYGQRWDHRMNQEWRRCFHDLLRFWFICWYFLATAPKQPRMCNQGVERVQKAHPSHMEQTFLPQLSLCVNSQNELWGLSTANTATFLGRCDECFYISLALSDVKSPPPGQLNCGCEEKNFGKHFFTCYSAELTSIHSTQFPLKPLWNDTSAELTEQSINH